MPSLSERLPLDSAEQRSVTQQWERANSTGEIAQGVRSVVQGSWRRALGAQIRPDLCAAPMVWDADALERARASEHWLGTALHALRAQRGAYAAGGSVVTLFDASGRMLHAEGESRALDGLAGINFRPGSLWSEAAVGTNGPGTALVANQPVHVVGAEHFCEQWHDWHCAAVPLRDPLTGGVAGALDVSGFRSTAHPHTLMLVVALAAAIEQMLSARELERRSCLLERFASLVARWPGEAIVAVDRAGAIVAASPAAPATLHPLAPVPHALRDALAALAAGVTGAEQRQAALPGPIAGDVIAHGVTHHGRSVGVCLLVRPPAALQRSPVPQARAARPAGARARSATRYSLDDLVGDSPALRQAHRVAIAAAANSLPVLLLGESGTGKEVFAQGIHAASARASAPFIAVNCAALPRELIESELFGYVGGAFSGARREGGLGKFEAAHGGTIFLDEVGDLPLAAQAALLRVLEEGEVTRVGATRGVPVDVRVIAATNRDIRDALRTGAFREDLYYRLSVLAIELPSLRERRADVARLASRFLAEAESELGREGQAFSTGALDALRAHDWPGNVRELRNVVWRAVALATNRVITPDALGLGQAPAPILAPAHTCGCEEALTVSAAASPDADIPLDPERDRVARAVEQAGSMAEAAAILGVARSTLYRQMARYGLHATRVVRG